MKQYLLGLYEKAMPNFLSIEEKLNETKNSGFDFMEISVDESDEKLERLKWSRQEKEKIIEAMDYSGTRIMTLCLSGHRRYPLGSEDADTRNKSLSIMFAAIELAVDLGIRIIQIAGYDEYYKESNQRTREYFLKNLDVSVAYASKSGVILAFETMETEFMDTVAKAMKYVEKINSPFLKVYPDIGNLTNSSKIDGHDIYKDLLTGSGHIVAVHLKETKPGKYREIPFGSGHVDFDKALDIIAKIGVKMFVGEFWHDGNDNWRESLVNTNIYLRKILDKKM